MKSAIDLLLETFPRPATIVPKQICKPANAYQDISQKKLLNTAETCHFLNIHRATLYRQLKSGMMIPPIRIGRKLLFNRAALERWVAAGSPPTRKWLKMPQSKL